MWKTIFEFCVQYWKELLSGLVLLITILVNILRKRPSYNGVAEIKEDVLELLPELICRVEKDGNGQLKKNAVLELVNLYVKKKYHIEIPFSLTQFFDCAIESILSTPQKKER